MTAPRTFATFTFLYHLLLLAYLVCAEDVTTTIDDSDHNIQHIVGKWTQFTGPNGSQYYNGTETLARDAGATILYTFNGTSIAVFGTQCDPEGGNTTVSSYTLDHFGASIYTVPPGVICNQNFVNFYTSPPLQYGQHNLVIKNLNDNSWFFLDFLKVTAPRTDASESSTSTPSTPSTPTPPPNPSGTPADSTGQTSKSSAIGTGAIVGIAVGAAVLLTLLVIAALWLKKRRRASYSDRPEEGLIPGIGAPPRAVVAPYIVPSDTTTHSTNYGPHSKGAPSYPQNAMAAVVNGPSNKTATSPMMSPAHTESNPVEMHQVRGSVVEPEAPSHRYSVAATVPPAYVK